MATGRGKARAIRRQVSGWSRRPSGTNFLHTPPAPAPATRPQFDWPSLFIQTTREAGGLRDGDRADRRACRTAHLERQADERELVDAGRGQFLEVEVLDDRDAGTHEQQEVARQRHMKLRV